MRTLRTIFSTLMLLVLVVSLLGNRSVDGAHAEESQRTYVPVVDGQAVPAQAGRRVYLPVMFNLSDYRSPLIGFETDVPSLLSLRVQNRSQELNGKMVRINGVDWSTVQPTPDGGYNWAAMDIVANQIRIASASRLTPLVIVHRSPFWATGKQTLCGAVAEEHFQEYANFMREVVLRYSLPPYNVHHWEIGNEPDVDPSLVDANSPFGCWGDQNGVYYGGKHYGDMLKVVAPAIRSADPGARIYTGGMLLDDPTPCTFQTPSKPSCFFEGILTAGAADSFDVVAFHSYTSDDNPNKFTLARQKVAYLKSVMAKYGVSKPLVITETALRCPLQSAPVRCTTPSPAFFESQADFVPRMIVQSLADGIESLYWFTMNGQGWDNAGLLDREQLPRQSFYALKTLAQQTANATGAPTAIGDYGDAVEAFRFALPTRNLDVVWSKDEGSVSIKAPAGFLSAFDRSGSPLAPDGTGTLSTVTGTIYVNRTR